MTTIASIAFKHISINSPVFSIHSIFIVMFMAVNTTENAVIPFYGMTIRATVPLSLMIATVNGEILRIMTGKICRHPIGIQGMTKGTILRKR
jgi:hypothetical protein